MRLLVNEFLNRQNTVLPLFLYFLINHCTETLGRHSVRTKTYQNLDSEHYCVRRLNRTHSIGCNSERSGNVGVLHIVQNATTDFEWILASGDNPPYIVGVYVKDFTVKNLQALNSSQRVVGVILLRRFVNSEQISFSPDNKCPNEGFGFYAQYTEYKQCSKSLWNNNEENQISGAMFMAWRFPIFMMNNNESNHILTKCFDEHNKPASRREWPLCGVQLYSRMRAVRNAVHCIRRTTQRHALSQLMQMFSSGGSRDHCVPLQSFSFLVPLYPMYATKTPNNESYIIVAARLDSLSLFDQAAFGVKSAVTSVITLLSIIDTLKARTREKQGDMNVLFAFFNGESWGYIGSSRLADNLFDGILEIVQDSRHAYRPPKLNITQIKYIIELDQISSAPSLGNESGLWMHIDPITTKDGTVETKLVEVLSSASSGIQGLTLKNTTGSIPLPPSSLQSFLDRDNKTQGVVLSSYDDRFGNPQYHSFLDNGHSLTLGDIDYIHAVTTLVSRAVLELLQDRSAASINANKERVSEIFQCFFGQVGTPGNENGPYTCPLLKNTTIDYASQPFSTQIIPADFFGLSANASYFPYLSRVNRLLLNLTGTINSTNSKACDEAAKNEPMYTFQWDPLLDICTRSSFFKTVALSPAFHDEGFDAGSKFSTWVESINEQPMALVFLMPSTQQQLTEFLLGLVFTVSSLAVVFFFNKHAQTLLTPAE